MKEEKAARDIFGGFRVTVGLCSGSVRTLQNAAYACLLIFIAQR